MYECNWIELCVHVVFCSWLSAVTLLDRYVATYPGRWEKQVIKGLELNIFKVLLNIL